MKRERHRTIAKVEEKAENNPNTRNTINKIRRDHFMSFKKSLRHN
jgi:hypothetical protein